ncbi:PTS glucitol/sorbitol transporter subunit IIA [Metabacillus rhizolycopersici]|jgi:PTS system glucitol/sorbitol-specific IIA component|uniref:PTS glucitol/sorbitol transporter subunit IIA n=1 Tax=Metabacillus rhizolycopersici TaxID=2875709 RepID=A0ABS7UVX9_9BACI|nr:PTS glucitol/sorbitol transporter subunit IIA [Metabacillus rhizolycopersici]MBZ5752095.1 PTS glucitol/sorbitol transporter subunit IIA [Metabacillus rhizolycopersici]
MLKTKIIEIGPVVPEFKEENLLILFGSAAPPELKEISVVHEVKQQPENVLVEGGTLEIGNKVYEIQKVGSLANKNFEDLGHLSIYFKDDTSEELLPGAILVTPGEYPELEINDYIVFK